MSTAAVYLDPEDMGRLTTGHAIVLAADDGRLVEIIPPTLPREQERGRVMSRDDVTLTADRPDGFMVVKAGREHLRGNAHPYFTVTAEVYSSRRAFEMGNTGAIHSCGCLHDDVLDAFPDLAPIVALHSANAVTGEPMHGPANGWYRLGGKDMAHELEIREQGRRNYYQAPEPYDEDGYLAPAFAQYFIDMAARNLGVSVDELPNVQDPDLFAEWVESVARPRWQEAADRVNALIDERSNEGAVTIPAEQTDEPSYAAELDGLRAEAVLMDEDGYRNGVGWYHKYSVKVWTDDKRRAYRTTFGGSVADHQDGVVNARQAAFGVLSELLDFSRYDSAEDAADEFGMEWHEMSADQRRSFERCHAAAERMADALEANENVIGS